MNYIIVQMQIRHYKQIQGISNEIVPTENECKKIKLKNCTMGNITFVGRFCVNLADVLFCLFCIAF